MNCPSCQHSIDPGARTCPACGAPVPVGPGSVIAGRFELLAPLGAGGMGTVFKARDRRLEETVAVKVVRLEHDPQAVERFHSEVRLARRVKHRNVCGVHEYGEDGGVVFCAMELVEGRNLREVLREAPLSWERSYDLALAAAAGLQAIHEAGVIHRDVKAANLMIDRQGEVRLVDFGIAKPRRDVPDLSSVSDSGITDSQHVVGSPEYMSPEQVRGASVDARSDIYSFGIVLYELFTGQVPFREDTPMKVMLKHLEQAPPLEGAVAQLLPAALLPVLRKALAKDPRLRYASVMELTADLRAARRALVTASTDEVSTATPAALRSLSRRWRRLTQRLTAWPGAARTADRVMSTALAVLGALALAVLGYILLAPRPTGETRLGTNLPGSPAISSPSGAAPSPGPTASASASPAPTTTTVPVIRAASGSTRPAAERQPRPLPTAPVSVPPPREPSPEPLEVSGDTAPSPMAPATPSPPTPPPPAASPLPRRGEWFSGHEPDVVAPACVSCPITYSALAERLGAEGDVSLEIVVDEEGRVVEATVVRADHEVLRDLALRNVKKWRYRPATKRGVAGKVRLEVVVKFRLEPGS